MNDFEYFSSLYTPLLFSHEIGVGTGRVLVLANAPYRAYPDGSVEICNLRYLLFGRERDLNHLELSYDEIRGLVETEAVRLIRNTTLLP